MLEDLKIREIEFRSVEEFLLELKKEFSKGDKKLVKMAELRRIEQRGNIMEEFVQEFWKVASNSRYKERVLVKEFKRGINRIIRRN